ncbi:MAG: flavin monoamine oxidase family protein [Phenylobacterium sp.]|uniref:flavin monoamine oxidase family protein n=1 Tax=Phenylobacterium sp. TaxID=1871053 RepID=UPI00391A7255
MNGPWDVLVIGAGFAGLVAAREASRLGCSVLVLEARDRLGGRAWSERRHGHVLELGGTWVHWSQPFVWTELERYGLALEETPSAVPEEVIVARGGRPERLSVREAGAALSQALALALSEAERVFPRPFDPGFAASEVMGRAKMSLAERLAQLNLQPLQAELLSAFFATLGHCHLDDLAYVEALRGWALAGRDYERFSDALARYRLRDGTGALIEAIRGDADAQIRLSSPVVSVEQSADHVRLQIEGGKSVLGRSVVVSAPLNVLTGIDFSPPLNAAKTQHALEGHAGRGVKGYAAIRQNVGVFQGFAADPAPITNVMTDASGPQGSRLIFFGPDPSRLNAGDARAVEAALRAFIPDAEVTEVISHDWVGDPYAKGTWCHFRPGQTAYFPASRDQEGRVFFASADTADGWRGFIDGAIERGLKVGREAAQFTPGLRR